MRKMKSKVLAGFLPLFIATLVVWVGQAQSQEAYPTKPIEIIVPYAPGGSWDLFARTSATFLSKKWGVPVNVVNKPGGNSIPGILSVYTANPDGYTMLADGISTSSCRITETDLPFKIMDRTFVATIGVTPQLLIGAINTPLKTLKDMADEAKRNPNFTWSWIGLGYDSSGFALRQFFKEANIDPQKTKVIAVSGGSQVVVMVAGGQALMGSTTLGSAASSMKAGTLRGLAITAKKRDPDWPDIPTTAEAGYPNTNIMQWMGFSGPPKLPAFIVAKWEKTLDEVLRDPEMIAALRKFGTTAGYLDSKATREYVIKEIDELTKLYSAMKSGG